MEITYNWINEVRTYGAEWYSRFEYYQITLRHLSKNSFPTPFSSKLIKRLPKLIALVEHIILRNLCWRLIDDGPRESCSSVPDTTAVRHDTTQPARRQNTLVGA